jgi:hypothetical protein
MAALRELQALEMLDGITDEVALNEDTPNESDSYTDDSFFEEFAHIRTKPYQRDGFSHVTNAEWMKELQALHTLDGITDGVTQTEDTPNKINKISQISNSFFEEFSDTCKDYPRDGIDQFTHAELMNQMQELSKSCVPPGSYRQRRFQSVWGIRFDTFRKDFLNQK